VSSKQITDYINIG